MGVRLGSAPVVLLMTVWWTSVLVLPAARLWLVRQVSRLGSIDLTVVLRAFLMLLLLYRTAGSAPPMMLLLYIRMALPLEFPVFP